MRASAGEDFGSQCVAVVPTWMVVFMLCVMTASCLAFGCACGVAIATHGSDRIRPMSHENVARSREVGVQTDPGATLIESSSEPNVSAARDFPSVARRQSVRKPMSRADRILATDNPPVCPICQTPMIKKAANAGGCFWGCKRCPGSRI